MTYLSLFISSFMSATVLPGSSEILLVTLIQVEQYSTNGLLLCAAMGNTLGSVCTWLMGRYAATWVEGSKCCGQQEKCRLDSKPTFIKSIQSRVHEKFNKYAFEQHNKGRNNSHRNGHRWVAKLGYSALLFSWTPLMGDAICFAAGTLKIPLLIFIPLVAIGKTLRYILLIWLFAP